MALPPLATKIDVTNRAPDLTVIDTQVTAMLADASAIIRRYAGREWVNDTRDALAGVPDGIPGVCAMMVLRALRMPDGATQETIGSYNVSYAQYATDRLYLTRTEKMFIRRASGGSTGAFSISTFGAVGYLGVSEDSDWTG
jgi:hypothetical protein